MLLWGQSKFEIQADELFEQSSFEGAIDNYKLCLKKNPDNIHCILKIAQCFQKLNDFKEAEKWYSKAFLIGGPVEPEYKYNYAYCLYINGKNSEAKRWFLNYNNSLTNPDRRAQKFLESIKSYNEYFADASFVLINNLDINSETSDFPAAIFYDELAFVSNKSFESQEIDKDEEIYNLPYNIYFSKKDINTGKFSSQLKMKKYKNEQYQSGPLVFYNNYSNIIVCQTSGQRVKKDDIRYYTMQLYEGVFNKYQRKITLINRIKLLDASNMHPTVNEAGTILIFSSNIDEDINGMDLFMSEKKDGVWGEPERLGDGINTTGDEVFPFLFNDSILYFASNANGGLGGLDIFRINLMQPNLGIENLGYPVNSSYDDFSIIVDSSGMNGYFASNRPGGRGYDDIYSFETIKVRFKGLVKNNENDKPVKDAKVLVYTSGGEAKTIFSDSMGNFEVIVNPKEEVRFEIYSDEYVDYKVSKIKPTEKNKIFHLEPEKDVFKEQMSLKAIKGHVIKKKSVQSDSVCVFLEIIDPADGKVISSSLVPDLWVDKKLWDTFVIEYSK